MRSTRPTPPASAPNAAPLSQPEGAFSPFQHRAFVLLWTATVVSNIGTWMHEVGAGWLMATLDPTPATVALVQAATTLPVFFFALLAGTLADRFDKRRMLMIINLTLSMIVAALAVMVWRDQVTPRLLVLFTFAIGTGTAFMAPVWLAVVPSLVPRARLRPAIAMNSMGINISRAIGPAIAGVLIATVGLVAPFVLNAASYIVIVAALIIWTPPERVASTEAAGTWTQIKTGLSHVRGNAGMIATLVRAAGFFLFASAYWALLPLIARSAEGGDSTLYGTMMALIGAGAVTGALLLPRVAGRFDADTTVRIGTTGTALALSFMALSTAPLALMAAAFLGGLSWIAVLTSFHVSAQTSLPDWVRARGMSVFLMVFFGAMALGSLVWGQLATVTSLPVALLVAAAGMMLAIIATARFSLMHTAAE